MSYYPDQQVQAAIAQLDQAIYHHEQWYKNLVRVLIARLPPDTSDLESDSYARCRFGQWYDSDSSSVLRDYPTYLALGEAHVRMHRGAMRLLERVADDLPISVTELDQFNNLLDHMSLELESLRLELASNVQNKDPLTGTLNRNNLLTDLREQQAMVRRGIQSCALAMIDVDEFKKVNDVYGHTMGDVVLSAVAQCLQTRVRPYDHLYRYGGEEFLLCMPQVSVEAATSAAERLRIAIEALEIPCDTGGEIIRVTASFGVAPLDPTHLVETSIDRADKAMYRAKSSGRNRVNPLPHDVDE
jgi:diguanylate cyclase